MGVLRRSILRLNMSWFKGQKEICLLTLRHGTLSIMILLIINVHQLVSPWPLHHLRFLREIGFFIIGLLIIRVGLRFALRAVAEQ